MCTKTVLMLTTVAVANLLGGPSTTQAMLIAEDVKGDVDKFNAEPGWTPVEGHSGVPIGSLPVVPAGEVFLSDQDATDVNLNADGNNLTLTFGFDVGILSGITAARIEFWGLDIEARTGDIKVDGNDSENLFSLTLAPAGFDDYVTLSRYDLSTSELNHLNDGLLSIELFSPAPGGGGDSIAFDFVRLIVEYNPPIPAVSEWGLVVMLLLVLAAGTLVYTRRRTRQA